MTGLLWDDGAWQSLPALPDDAECDICVVGLGGSGLACIDELLSLGLSAVGLDAGQVAGAAAGRNGGFLRAGLAAFHHDAVQRFGRERALRLYRLTEPERDRLARDFPAEVKRVGYLRRADDAAEEKDCRAQLDAMRTDDLAAEWYDGAAGRGVLVRRDAACNPLSLWRAQARSVLSRGARLFEHSPARRITGGEVETGAGRVRCRAVVVAVDGALHRVVPELEGRVRPARLQMLGTAPLAESVALFATGTRWGWDYWQQQPDGSIALGGCRDAGGDAEWTEDTTPTAAVQDALERRLACIGVAAPVVARWAATSGFTNDGLPILEEVRPRVWAVGGYGGTGNLVGQVCGRAAARLASGFARELPLG